MRPRKVIVLKASNEPTRLRRGYLLWLWGYRVEEADPPAENPPACVVLDGLFEPHHITEARERWPGVPVLMLVPYGQSSEPRLYAAGASCVIDPLMMDNGYIREQLAALCARKRGPKTAARKVSA